MKLKTPKTKKAATFGSNNLIEMFMERQPAKWAAYQIAAKRNPAVKSIGEAMDMIERIVAEAIAMDRFQQAEKKQGRKKA